MHTHLWTVASILNTPLGSHIKILLAIDCHTNSLPRRKKSDNNKKFQEMSSACFADCACFILNKFEHVQRHVQRWPLPRQNDRKRNMTKNITFPQPCCREVIKACIHWNVNETVRILSLVRTSFLWDIDKNNRIDKKKINMLRGINGEWCEFHENTLTMWEIKWP